MRLKCLVITLKAALCARVHPRTQKGDAPVTRFQKMQDGCLRTIAVGEAHHHVDRVRPDFHYLHDRTTGIFQHARVAGDWSMPETMRPAGRWLRKMRSRFSSSSTE